MRLKCIVAYDGTNYAGFQSQIGKKTIQETIENTLRQISKEDITIYASGRTDANVHAKAQVFHFDTSLDISMDSWKRGFKSLLPSDIYVKDVERVDDDFHSRFNVKSKEYRYYINIGEYNPLIANYSIHMFNLDVNKMNEAIKLLIGEKDFRSFTQQIDSRKKTVKTIFDARIEVKGDLLEVVFIGSGFLKYQIRIMIGTLLDVGLGKKSVNDINIILDKKDRCAAGKTVDARGLILYKVNY